MNASLLKPAALAALSLCLASGALAHDTWFAAAPARSGGEVLLTLGTGNRFPRFEFTVAAAYVETRACRSGHGEAVALEPLREGPTALFLRTATKGRLADAALSCWAQLVPFDIEVDPAKVPVYLDEIDATPALRSTWAALQARGLPWRERYTKHARAELAGTQPGNATGAPSKPVPIDMDLLLEAPHSPVQPGDSLAFTALRGGKPLPGLALELVGETGAPGEWRRTDAQGRVRYTAPAAGRWVLRGTELQLSTQRPDTWDSGFVTLVFDVGLVATPKTATP